MSFSEACSVRLLVLFLAALGFSDANTSATPMMTQYTSQMISSTADLQQDVSTTELPITTQQTDVSLDKKKHNISLSGSKMETDVILAKPTELELWCSLPVNPAMEMQIIEVTWTRNNQTIEEHNITRNKSRNSWCSQHIMEVRDQNSMGNYACVFKNGEKDLGSVTFNVKVPEVKETKKIVSYVGDFVVLTCKTGNYTPIYWVWYTNNGSKQVPINDTQSEKYTVNLKYPNTTQLVIKQLSEKDDGVYGCHVVFELGDSQGNVTLKVLTYMTPLKPFLAIAAEVLILVAAVFIYEVYSRKKETHAEAEKEFEQTEQLKSEDSNGVENSTTRHRKV